MQQMQIQGTEIQIKEYAMFDKVVDEIAAELNITCQPDVCEEKGDDLKENLIEQVGNVHQGLAAILKFLS